MAKSSVMLAAVMMGAVAIISPAQAVILSQESTQQVQEENASSLIAHKERFRRHRRYCWRRYGRLRCRDTHDYERDDRWRRQRWKDRRKWEKERERRWRKRRREWEKRRRWENRRRRDEDYWRRRRSDRDYEIWRRKDKREDFRDKLDRWLNTGSDDDD